MMNRAGEKHQPMTLEEFQGLLKSIAIRQSEADGPDRKKTGKGGNDVCWGEKQD